MGITFNIMEEYNGKWGMTSALWAIFAIIIVFGLFVWCHQNGKDKAALAGSIQELYGRLNCVEPIVAENAKVLGKTTRTLAATVQGVSDMKDRVFEDIDALDAAVFVGRCGNGRSGGCNDTRYVKRNTYCLDNQSLEQIETCGG